MHQVETWIAIAFGVTNIITLVLLFKKQKELAEKENDDRLDDFSRSHREDMDRLWRKVDELEVQCSTNPKTSCCKK
jgi:hypothetical protein